MNSPANPFKLETDDKKFFFQIANQAALEVIPEYSKTLDSGAKRIKNIHSQLEELAKKREEILFKDSQIDYIFKKEKPSMQLNDFITGIGTGPVGTKDKKFRVRALLKEKKESIHEFLEKKKEIYLSKMNINIKKEQTTKLEDCIKDEEETLKARKLYFENDVQFMHKFIEGVKKTAEEAQVTVENELKVQQNLVSRLNALEAETQKIDNLISKDTEILKNYMTYKTFIDSFIDPDRHVKPYVRKVQQQEQVLFMTENRGLNTNELPENDSLGLVIRFQPVELFQIFTNAEENNIRQIQNLHDKQDEMETVIKQFSREQSEFQRLKNENLERIDLLEKTYERKMTSCNKLREMKKINKNKLNILDNENVDLPKVKEKIYEIFHQINPKKANELEDGGSEKPMKRAMTEIEQEIQRLRSFMKRERQMRPQLMAEIEKEIKESQKQQTLARKREEDKEKELKKMRDQEKKRSQPANQLVKGRKDMGRVFLEKKTAAKKQVNVKSVDQSQKYFVND